jgi:hypothetical protein
MCCWPSVTTQLVDNFFSLRNIGINERQTTVDEVQHDDVNSIFITSEIIVLFYNGQKCLKKEFQCWGDEAKVNHFRKYTSISKNEDFLRWQFSYETCNKYITNLKEYRMKRRQNIYPNIIK